MNLNTSDQAILAIEQTRQIIGCALSEGYSLALWKLPNEPSIQLIISENIISIESDFNLEDSESGFLFAPFDRKQKKIFLPSDFHYEIREEELICRKSKGDSYLLQEPIKIFDFHRKGESNQIHTSSSDLKNKYEQLVSDCVHHINSGKFEKIVPTRRKKIELPIDFDLIKLFEQLNNQYPNALVSLVSTPDSGTWIGATPEPLVSLTKNQEFKTVALAGTQLFNPNIPINQVTWTQKEIEEQALVERYIISCFKKIRVREYDEIGPRTFQAGNLLHLRSDFTVNLKEVQYPALGSVMLNLMHPTSAVCGMPMENAMDFLVRQEGYNREFYTGYLGPIQMNGETQLFVNLRCMKWSGTEAWLYAGAGVTADSIPELEYKECEMKMETLHQMVRSL